ncbi:MAG: TolC family protein [Epsilonproteobacteria bacterium]|nr:TolC family protein [Campylobacterota bacterium]
MRISLLFITSSLFATSLFDTANLAINNSYKLKSYSHQVKAQQYRYYQAKDNYLPSLNANFSYSKDKYHYDYPTTTVNYDSKVKSYSIELKQTLFNPSIFALIDENKLKIKYTALQKDAYQQKLLNDTINTYIDALSFKNTADIYSDKITNYQSMYNTINKKYQVHFATKTDLIEAQTKLISAKNDYMHTILNYQNALKKLKLLTHTNIELPHIIINNTITDIPIKSDISNNPNVRLAHLNIKISKHELNKRKYGKYPTLNFQASYSNSDSSDSITKKDEYMLSLNLNVPLYNATTNDYQNEAKELYLSSKTDYEDTLNSTQIDERKTIYIIKQYLEILKKDKEVIKSTKLFLKKQEVSYNNKLISLSDLYSAKNDYFSALIQFFQDKANLLKNYIDLLYIQGKLDLSTIKQIQTLYFKGE